MTALPQLEEPCPTCNADGTTFASRRTALIVWTEQKEAAYEEWRAAKMARGINSWLTSEWQASPEFEALGDPPPRPGCSGCNFRGVVLTAAGRELVDVLRRHEVVGP